MDNVLVVCSLLAFVLVLVGLKLFIFSGSDGSGSDADVASVRNRCIILGIVVASLMIVPLQIQACNRYAEREAYETAHPRQWRGGDYNQRVYLPENRPSVILDGVFPAVVVGAVFGFILFVFVLNFMRQYSE